jgi:hypothetical protein
MEENIMKLKILNVCIVHLIIFSKISGSKRTYGGLHFMKNQLNDDHIQ